ncbi:MAG: NADAR family protein [Gloeocapsa sp. DLM2.Bin57]|nr:MAG: NADAR family protein [Gloeocapsa sp. DLM2.Bin57]
MTIYFYKASEPPYGCFSNFAEYGFYLDNRWWKTSEHYYQAQKFITTEPDWSLSISEAQTPKEAAAKGRDRSHYMRPDWDQVKDEVMFNAVLTKFQTHSDIRQILLATQEELIIENSPVDYYWGCGQDGTGKNRLGEILMKVRSILDDLPI